MDITLQDILDFDESLEIFGNGRFIICENRNALKKITDYMSNRPNDKFVSLSDLIFEEGFGICKDYARNHLGWINGKFVLFDKEIKILFDDNEYDELTIPSGIYFPD